MTTKIPEDIESDEEILLFIESEVGSGIFCG